MMKRYINIKMISILVVVCLLVSFLFPIMLDNNKKAKYQNAIIQLEHLRNLFASSPDILTNIGEWSKYSSSWYMEPIKANDRFAESLQIESGLDLMRLTEDIEMIDFTDWDQDELVVLLHRIYIKQPESSTGLLTGYDTKNPPDFFAIQAFFNSYDISRSCSYMVTVDPDGYYQFIGCDSTFDISNGIDSVGHIQLDSTELWPKKKSVDRHETEI